MSECNHEELKAECTAIYAADAAYRHKSGEYTITVHCTNCGNPVSMTFKRGI